MVCKIGFPNWNTKIALLVVTYNIKLFRTGADRRSGILMSLLLLAAETKSKLFWQAVICFDKKEVILTNSKLCWQTSSNFDKQQVIYEQ